MGQVWDDSFDYGGRSRRTHLLGDQLDRAGAGSWQIADGGATRKAAAGGTSVGDWRVHFVVEPYGFSWSPNRALLDTGANMVSRTRECACPDMCELVWGEPGRFLKKKGSEKTPPLVRYQDELLGLWDRQKSCDPYGFTPTEW